MGKYFPDKIFHEIQAVHDFIAKWYSSHLESMNEPSFFDLRQDRKIHSYRFLWLRSFDKPVCVRIEINSDGSAWLVSKMTKGIGGSGPGEIFIDATYPLSKNKAKTLLSCLENADFWNLTTKDDLQGNDGAQWIIEGVKNGKYHIVDRWSPEDGPFREAALYLINLSKLKSDEIY